MHFIQTVWLLFKNIKGGKAELLDDPGRKPGADPPDQARAEVAFDAV